MERKGIYVMAPHEKKRNKKVDFFNYGRFAKLYARRAARHDGNREVKNALKKA
jgi:hypothetical protein